MSDGIGCKCFASYQGECACDADWTPQEVYDLRDKVDYYSKLSLDNSLTFTEKILEINSLKQRVDELQADNLRLREALKSAWSYTHTNEKLMDKITSLLLSTQSQSLAEHDNEVIERCKNIVANDALAITFQSMGAYRSAIIKQIGELKAEHD